MEILVLASGSSGNALLVRSPGGAVLVDAGISALQVRRRLEAFGLTPEVITGVVVTHEHTDHARGLEVLCRRHRLPVWATTGTWSRLGCRSEGGGEILPGRTVRIGGLRLLPIPTSHDAREPVALRLDDGRHRVAVCTDTGCVTTLLEQRLAGCELLLVEANHDGDMLRHGPYPWPLKQRIASRLGHLGNHQTAEAVARLGWDGLRAVVGLHLSEENNAPELVRGVLVQSTANGAQVGAVTRSEMLRVLLDRDRVLLETRPVPPASPPRRR